MNILVTNDDGIDSDGLTALVQALRAVRNDKGLEAHRVTVIAPDGERSGVSHAMTLRRPTKVRKLGNDTFTCSGTPADCVVVAGLGILEYTPDVVISGINVGPNLGTDIIYSGTCGAARQAALANVPGIAVSCVGKEGEYDFSACATFVAKNLPTLMQIWQKETFINLNGPSSSDLALLAKWSIPGRNRYQDNLKCFDGADGYRYCFLAEGRSEREFSEVSDHQIVADGFISLSLIHIHPEAFHPSHLNGTVLKTE